MHWMAWPTPRPLNALVPLTACRVVPPRASARSITAVIPYYGYARADRKVQGRESIAAKLTANLITEAGAHRVLSIDLHSGQTVGYFDIPVDHVYGERQAGCRRRQGTRGAQGRWQRVNMHRLAQCRCSTMGGCPSLHTPAHATAQRPPLSHVVVAFPKSSRPPPPPPTLPPPGETVILDYLASKRIATGDLVVVSPDVGGVARARAFAKKLNDAPLAIVDKRRSAHNVSEVMNLIGDVKGKVRGWYTAPTVGRGGRRRCAPCPGDIAKHQRAPAVRAASACRGWHAAVLLCTLPCRG